jgi:hypothetical protein
LLGALNRSDSGPFVTSLLTLYQLRWRRGRPNFMPHCRLPIRESTGRTDPTRVALPAASISDEVPCLTRRSRGNAFRWPAPLRHPFSRRRISDQRSRHIRTTADRRGCRVVACRTRSAPQRVAVSQSGRPCRPAPERVGLVRHVWSCVGVKRQGGHDKSTRSARDSDPATTQ